MRISTSQLYATGTATITGQQSDLQHLQQQISTGRRVVTPSDDPVASARSLQVSQAVSRTNQQLTNQKAADSALTNLDSQIGAIGDIVQYVRERAVQAGNSTLTTSDKEAIAADVKAQFDALMNLANSKDANGEYLFSGFQGDMQPFTGTLAAGITYQGDQGQRSIQVSNTRQIPTSINGAELFQNIDSLPARANVANTGGGTITPTPTVVSAGGWGSYELQYSAATNSLTIYQRGSTTPLGAVTYATGAAISLPPAPATAAINVTISDTAAGSLADGDRFYVDGGGKSDIFSTMRDFVGALQGAVTGSEYSQVIADTLDRLDNAQDNSLGLRARIGSSQVEVEALQAIGSDASVQYAQRMDDLVGVDYAKAISDFSLQKTYLEASQSSFVKITGLSLFNYLSS